MNSPNSTQRSRRSALDPKAKWQPAFYTPRRYVPTDGDDIIEFARDHFNVLKGFRAGLSLEFTDWQKWLLQSLYERRTDGRLRYRRALIGLPRKQGKSLLGSAIAVYGLVAGEAGAEIYAVAGDRQQARIIFGEAKQQVLNSPILSKECNVYRDAIEMPRFGSVFRVLSSEFRGQAGLNPSLVLFDELWNQQSSDLYDQMTLGSGARLEPLVVSITTAGYDLDSLCGQLYQYGKQVAADEVDDEAFGFWWWEAKADCKIDDKRQWAISNPNVAEGLLDPEDLMVATKQTSEMAFRRWRLNQWVRSQESWLPIGAWEQCVGDAQVYSDAPTYVGIDMALKHDSIAIVWAQKNNDGKFAVQSKIWQPSDEGVDVAQVEAFLRDLHLKYNVKEFAYDPAYFQRSAEILSDDGLPMVEYPQTGSRMIPACGNAYELIVSSQVVHEGSPTFTDQVLSAAQRMTDNGWRLSKGKSKRKIDACIAMVMALDRANSRPRTGTEPQVLNVWD
jgi:phage terminase large subunit-like protein